MRKSVRTYVNGSDIGYAYPVNSAKVAVWHALNRTGVLKGRCFVVTNAGVYVGPNYATINTYLAKGQPQLELSQKGKDFVRGNSKVPTHITVIDKTGNYL